MRGTQTSFLDQWARSAGPWGHPQLRQEAFDVLVTGGATADAPSPTEPAPGEGDGPHSPPQLQPVELQPARRIQAYGIVLIAILQVIGRIEGYFSRISAVCRVSAEPRRKLNAQRAAMEEHQLTALSAASRLTQRLAVPRMLVGHETAVVSPVDHGLRYSCRRPSTAGLPAPTPHLSG